MADDRRTGDSIYIERQLTFTFAKNRRCGVV